MDIKEIVKRCDHTQLSVTATWEDIRALIDDGIRYGTASVCIPPCYVAEAKRYAGGRLPICTVIGFPNGYNTEAVKVFETAEAVANGADEIDMVINIGDLNEEEKIKMCEIVTPAKADFIKTSTGFSKAGATREDVALFKAHVGKDVKIKAAGGISSVQDAEKFVALGADRLGTSRIVKIVKEEHLL